MFSGSQSHRGKSQTPVAWVAFAKETKRMKPTDKAILRMVKRRLTRLSIAGVLATSAWGQSGTITDIATLPEISIRAFQNSRSRLK